MVQTWSFKFARVPNLRTSAKEIHYWKKGKRIQLQGDFLMLPSQSKRHLHIENEQSHTITS